MASEPQLPPDDPTEVHLLGIRIDDVLHPDQQLRFRRLCMATSPEELKELVDTVRLHLDQVRAAAAPETDLEMAEQVGASLEALIVSDQQFTGDERSLIRGAVEYFLLVDDADSDLHDSLGFDDDARVVNSVLDHVGRRDLRVLF